MSEHEIVLNDCLKSLGDISDSSVDLIYLDPPFFTQKQHRLSDRSGKSIYQFEDHWESLSDYEDFLKKRLVEMKRIMKETASIFFHCDNNASHIVRFLMDEIFGSKNFRSKIIWTYRRWSNSKKGLLPSYQEILFYSKTEKFKFNKIYMDYSPTTNVDQILQKRQRDERNKAIYARDEEGEIISSGGKMGVPLTDVWDLPYLNPKASERVGYPTQKPILLLERIIELVTDENDLVLDPFCGSGSTLVAAKLLKRRSVGFDISTHAVQLAESRLKQPAKTVSSLFEKGKDSYINKVNPLYKHVSEHLFSVVHRNKGIDGVLKQTVKNKPVLIRVQRENETIAEAAALLQKAGHSKGEPFLVLIVTDKGGLSDKGHRAFKNIVFLNSIDMSLNEIIAEISLQKPLIVV